MLLLSLCTGAAILGIHLAGGDPAPPKAAVCEQVDATGLDPGTDLRLIVGGRDVVISIPEGEGFTYGTFCIDIPSMGYTSEPLRRDGSLEAVWVCDVSGDGADDGVFIVRSGGSGGYVEIVVLESGPGGFSTRFLPGVPSGLVPDYMGHDTVWVQDGIIRRSSPTYRHDQRIRIDRQWDANDIANRKPPIKGRPDSNADPSGSTRHLRYNYAQGQWAQP
jgi:hypothetical protein